MEAQRKVSSQCVIFTKLKEKDGAGTPAFLCRGLKLLKPGLMTLKKKCLVKESADVALERLVSL